jgi:hypothetical protein
MHTENTFKTKTGYCQVLKDKIVLTRDGVNGNIAKVTMGNNISRPLLIYGLITLALFFLAFKSYREEKNLEAVLLIAFGLMLIYLIIKSLNNSAAPIIDREKIKTIEFKKSIPGTTRAYFIIYFENEAGKIKQRLILLPGSLSNGENETQKALKIMTAEFQQIKNAS